MRNRLAEEPANPVYEALAKKRLRRQSNRSTDKPNETSRRAAAMFEQSTEKMARLVASHPLICLGAAATLGIILGWWVKRK